MSFMLCAEPVRAPGTTANSPTSPAVQTSFMHVRCRGISQPSLAKQTVHRALRSVSLGRLHQYVNEGLKGGTVTSPFGWHYHAAKKCSV
jgi:hypothetical protein